MPRGEPGLQHGVGTCRPTEPPSSTVSDTQPDVVDASPESADDVIVVTRSKIDRLLIGLGAVVTVVLAIAFVLLLWGSNFAKDYVSDELSAQNITFPPVENMSDEEAEQFSDVAGEQVDSGDLAEKYAQYIAGHIDNIGGGMSYAELGGPEREANAAVQDAIAAGASQAEIDELQAVADEASTTRDTVFRGEILRGTLLNTYAWWTIGTIAGIAAWVAFGAAIVMLILTAFGAVHLARNRS
jgi:hypothetical protein